MDARTKRFTVEDIGLLTNSKWTHGFMDDDEEDPLRGHRDSRTETFAHHVYYLGEGDATAYNVVHVFENEDVAREWWRANKKGFSERIGVIPGVPASIEYLMEVRGIEGVEEIRAQLPHDGDIALYEGPLAEWYNYPGLNSMIARVSKMMKVSNVIMLRGREVHKVFVVKNNPAMKWNPQSVAVTLMRDCIFPKISIDDET
jgi:hypothetical protein